MKKIDIKELFDHLLETCDPNWKDREEGKKEEEEEEEEEGEIICEHCGRKIPKNFLEILDVDSDDELNKKDFLKKQNLFQKIKDKSPIKLSKNKKQESWHSDPKATKEQRKQYRRSSSWSNPVYKRTSSPSPKTKKVTWEENIVVPSSERKIYHRSTSQPNFNPKILSRKSSLQKMSDPPIQS